MCVKQAPFTLAHAVSAQPPRHSLVLYLIYLIFSPLSIKSKEISQPLRLLLVSYFFIAPYNVGKDITLSAQDQD